MYNRVIMIGRLVADPEMRTTPNGVNIGSCRIAVDRPYSKGGERKTDFFNVTCWRQQGEFLCRYFSKGRLIGVEGSIQLRDYTDRDGNKRQAVDVVADRVFFVESKNASGGSSPVPAESASAENAPAGGVSYSSGAAGDFEVVDDDDLPF